MKIFKVSLSVWIRILLSVGLLFFLFRQIDAKAIFGIIKNANKPLLLSSLLFFSANYILSIHRWEMLLRGAGVHLRIERIIMSFAGGVFFSLFLPSTIGGDLVRSIDLSVHTQKPHEIVATVVADRLSGYMGLVILTLFAVLVGWNLVVQDKAVLFSVAMITGVLIAVLVVLFNKNIYHKINSLLHSPTAGKIREALKNMHHEIHIFRHRKVIIFNNIIISILIQAVTPISFYIVALSLGIKTSIVYFFVLIPIISAVTLLPISIGGLGLRDASAIFFFSKIGISKDLAFAMSLTNFFFMFVYAIIGGLIYVLTVRHRRIQHHPPHPVHAPHQEHPRAPQGPVGIHHHK